MSPNKTETEIENDPERQAAAQKFPPPPPDSQERTKSQESDVMKSFQAVVYILAHTLIGIVVGVSIIFSFRSGIPLTTTNLHILLCVVGYNFLMAHGILCLAPENSWSSRLKLVSKRRFHWVLQIVGSGMALAGSFLTTLTKDIHWNTLHGQFALVAMVFTSVSLVNGLTSLYAFEFRRFLPTSLSKLTHICFGAVAYVAASVSLIYGFDKNSFRGWSTNELTISMIGFTSVLAFIVVINPLLTFATKSTNIVKK